MFHVDVPGLKLGIVLSSGLGGCNLHASSGFIQRPHCAGCPSSAQYTHKLSEDHPDLYLPFS